MRVLAEIQKALPPVCIRPSGHRQHPVTAAPNRDTAGHPVAKCAGGVCEDYVLVRIVEAAECLNEFADSAGAIHLDQGAKLRRGSSEAQRMASVRSPARGSTLEMIGPWRLVRT